MNGRSWVWAALAGLAILTGACGSSESARTASQSGGGATGFGREAASSGNAGDKAAPSSVAPAAPAASDAARTASGASEASRAAESGTAQTGASASQASDLGRKIISTVYLDLTVKDVQASFERINVIAEASGGLVSESNFRQDGDQRRASITIRVPAGRYQDSLGQIRGLATKVDSERATGNDVTEEFTDLQSRQRNLEATEQQLLTFLGQAKTIQEVLQVQDRLNTVRADIERAKGRMNLLNRLSDLATIQIQLKPEGAVTKATPKPTPLTALRDGWEASLEIVGAIGLGLLTFAAFSWWLVPFVVLGVWLVRRELRRRGRRPSPPSPPAEAGVTP